MNTCGVSNSAGPFWSETRLQVSQVVLPVSGGTSTPEAVSVKSPPWLMFLLKV